MHRVLRVNLKGTYSLYIAGRSPSKNPAGSEAISLFDRSLQHKELRGHNANSGHETGSTKKGTYIRK